MLRIRIPYEPFNIKKNLNYSGANIMLPIYLAGAFLCLAGFIRGLPNNRQTASGSD